MKAEIDIEKIAIEILQTHSNGMFLCFRSLIGKTDPDIEGVYKIESLEDSFLGFWDWELDIRVTPTTLIKDNAVFMASGIHRLEVAKVSYADDDGAIHELDEEQREELKEAILDSYCDMTWLEDNCFETAWLDTK